MEKFTRFTSKTMPIALNDIDTDVIIPAQYLTSTSREGYGENLFRRIKESDPKFPSNQAKFKDSGILVSGINFGCGSSREHAVWALVGAGFRVVIAKSFADIFSGNSAKNGLLLVELPEKIVDDILVKSENGDYKLTVDLAEQKIYDPEGKSIDFKYDQFRKHCLLNGLDDLDYILSQKDLVKAYENKHKDSKFYTSIANQK